MPVTAGAIIAGGSAIAKTISGAISAKKDREEAERLRQPFYKIQDEYQQNKNISEQLAMSGVPADIASAQSAQAQQGISGSLNAFKQTGASPNEFASLNKIFNDNTRVNAASNIDRQLGNIKFFTEQNAELAGQKTKQWAINEYQPYEAKLKEITERRAADKQNFWSGLGDISSVATSFGMNPKFYDQSSGSDAGVARNNSAGVISSLAPQSQASPVDTSVSAPPLSGVNLPQAGGSTYDNLRSGGIYDYFQR